MSTVWIICHYAMSPESGGYLRHHLIARELGKMGHEVYVISTRVNHMMTHPDAKRDAPFAEKCDGYTMVRLKTIAYPHAHHKKRILGWIQFGWQILGLTKRGLKKPDAVLYSSPNLLGFLGAERLARKTGARLVFEVRDIWPLTLIHVGNFKARNPLIRLMQWVEDRAYRVSHAVVSTLPNAYEHMVARGMPLEKFHWIPNGAHMSDEEMQQPLSLDVLQKLPTQNFLVGYVGTHGTANYLDPILDAASLLKNVPDVGIVMVGDGRCKEALKSRVLDEKINNVMFIDAIPKSQIQSMLANFDVCILSMLPSPLYRYGVSLNKLTDYFMAAKPVIYAADTGCYNPVREQNAGVCVRPGEASEIANAILEMKALSKIERNAMGKRGLLCVEKEYNYVTLSKKLNDILIN